MEFALRDKPIDTIKITLPAHSTDVINSGQWKIIRKSKNPSNLYPCTYRHINFGYRLEIPRYPSLPVCLVADRVCDYPKFISSVKKLFTDSIISVARVNKLHIKVTALTYIWRDLYSHLSVQRKLITKGEYLQENGFYVGKRSDRISLAVYDGKRHNEHGVTHLEIRLCIKCVDNQPLLLELPAYNVGSEIPNVDIYDEVPHELMDHAQTYGWHNTRLHAIQTNNNNKYKFSKLAKQNLKELFLLSFIKWLALPVASDVPSIRPYIYTYFRRKSQIHDGLNSLPLWSGFT